MRRENMQMGNNVKNPQLSIIITIDEYTIFAQ